VTRVFLIRHAVNDLIGRILYGRRPGVPLNEEGRTQAGRLARRLADEPIAAVYSSPLERALETARPLAESLGLEVQLSEPLLEIDCGDWTWSEIRSLDDDPHWRRFNAYRSGTRAPGGEMMIETQSRMVTELERLRALHPEQTIAVVSHGDPIRAALAYYLGMPLDFFWRLEISPASFSLVQMDEHGVRVLATNGICGKD
jgi:probable phosphomutase (TIGR03848 family)